MSRTDLLREEFVVFLWRLEEVEGGSQVEKNLQFIQHDKF